MTRIPTAAAPAARRPVPPAVRARAQRTGALILILGCFAASGAARLNDVARETPDFAEWPSVAALVEMIGPRSAAAAPERAVETASTPSADAAKTDDAAGAPDALSVASADTTPLADRLARLDTIAVDAESADLLETLRRRERELAEIAVELERRRVAIEAANRRIEERLGDLERAKEELATLVARIDRAAAEDVEHLITMYEKMKPKEAGALFDTMEASFAAGFLARMRADRASAILAKMDPEKAYAASVHLAGRNVRTDGGAD